MDLQRNQFKAFIVAIFAFLALSTDKPVTAAEPAGYALKRDIPYLGAGREEKLDWYAPSALSEHKVPAVIMIHGGGWSGGDKDDARTRDIAATVVGEGYALFSINYLLVKYQKKDGKIVYPIERDAFPQNIYDCKSAIQFVRKNATEFNIDPDRIALVGASAGGHLALLAGMTSGTDLDTGGLYPGFSTKVRGIIDLYGPPNLEWFGRFMFDGETAHKVPKYSPINHISTKTPPLLIFHGTTDETVKFADSERFVQRLAMFESTNRVKLDYEFAPVAGGRHSFHLSPQAENNQTDLRPKVREFLRRVFK